MKVFRAISISLPILLFLASPIPLLAQSNDSSVSLTVAAGRSMVVVLEDRVTVKSVGQPISGTLVEPLYAYDRIVVPAGTKVLGHIAALEDPSKSARTQAIMQGDLTSHRKVILQFDTFILDDEHPVAIHTLVKTEIPHLKRSEAPPAEKDSESDSDEEGGVHRVEREAKDQVKAAVSSAKENARDILNEISQPGRWERFKEAFAEKLPYHSQVISAGTGYNVELLQPLDFGRVTPIESAPADARPAPASILNARLLTSLDSSKTPRGTPIHAVVTEPVFSADHRLILPEGTMLDGEVTYATAAKGLHRNGQLRFLFESVHLSTGDASPMLASLQSIQTSGDDNVALDDEGGAKVKNSNTRFIAPALALLALRGNLDQGKHVDPDGDGHMISNSNPTAVSTGGFFGLGILGIPLAHMAPPVGLSLSIIGAARTVYTNVLAKGREVQFPADTQLRLQLAPGSSGAK